MQKVRKAVIPAAGFGTRFLPQTKAMPKEMLPIVDKPVIQYVVEELVEAGITDIFIVTGYHKRTIEDHFDAPSKDLVENLKMGGAKKAELLKSIEAISEMANFVYVRQKGPYGNGTPLLNVEDLIGNEPFIYAFSDDFIVASPSRFRQMIATYEEYGCGVMGAIRATDEGDYDRYGFAGGKELRPGLVDMDAVVEKPGKAKAPSNLAIVSGYLFTAEIFRYLHKALAALQTGQELYYNDALKLMLQDGHRMIAQEIQNGKYYDAGSKLGWLIANVDFALRDKKVNGDFKKYLHNVLG